MKTRVITRNQNGATAVEFAIILPVLILVLFGIIEFGLLLFNQQIITNASREGARAGIVNRDPVVRFRTETPFIEDVVSNWLAEHLVTFGDTAGAEIVVKIWDNAAGDFAELGEAVDPCTTFACRLSVTVTYKYKFLVLSAFLGEKDLSATSIMRLE